MFQFYMYGCYLLSRHRKFLLETFKCVWKHLSLCAIIFQGDLGHPDLHCTLHVLNYLYMYSTCIFVFKLPFTDRTGNLENQSISRPVNQFDNQIISPSFYQSIIYSHIEL